LRREPCGFSGHRVPDMLKGLRKTNEGGIRLSMLPGFRFLFAAIVLSLSILVFGLGAAALLRAAHEQFASTPAWRAAPEANFAQQADVPRDATRPVLAMLRVEPEPRSSDGVPAVNVAVSAEPAAMASPPAEPERITAVKPPQPETSEPEAARPDPAVESPQQTEAAAAPTDAITDTAEAAPPAPETKIASTEQSLSPQLLSPQVSSPQVSSPASDVTPVTSGPAESEPVSASAAAAADAASTRIATLGGPAIAIATSPVKVAVSAKPDQNAIRKHRQARRAAHRRRLAARARLAARLAAQPPVDPFGQQLAQPPTAARKR
jgi:hypothetical protein